MYLTNCEYSVYLTNCVYSGTDKERGLLQWNAKMKPEAAATDDTVKSDVYDFPCGMAFVKR